MTIRRFLFSVLLALPLLSIAAEPPTDLIYTGSNHDVNTTMDRLEKLVTSKGLSVIARLNHQGAAHKAKLELTGVQVLIFGSAMLGTPLMQENPAIGLDLPLRVAIYEDKNGKTQIVYHNPLSFSASHGITHQKTLNKMAGALKGLTSKAAE